MAKFKGFILSPIVIPIAHMIGEVVSSIASVYPLPRGPASKKSTKMKKRTARITDPNEAKRIVEEAEKLIKRGKSLTEKQKYEYEFAKIFLDELKKKKRGGE